MSILTITKKDRCDDKPCIKELEYGTFVTDVPSGNDCIYVKVKKRGRKDMKIRMGRKTPLTMEWESGCCVLLNLTYGTLRQIPGNTEVTPLKPCLTVTPVHKDNYHLVKKDNYCR